MSETTRILLITADPQLKEELLAALSTLGDRAPVPMMAETLRDGVETVRNRTPKLIIVELSTDWSALQEFAVEASQHCRQATIAAVFRPEAFDGDAGESAILIKAIRSGVGDFLRRPISSAELLELLARNRDAMPTQRAASGRVISFVSNKGGVGKSTLAVNSAVGLAIRHPDRVLLIDASLQLGVAASMLDVRADVTLADAARERSRLDETMIRQMSTPHESGLSLLAAPVDAVEAAAVDDDLISRVISLAKRTYDFVLIDTFPLFDRVVVAVLDQSDRTYVVVENVVPTVQGATKMLSVLEGIGFPKERQRVVLNRMMSIAGGLSAADVATRLASPIAHVFAYDKKIITSANIGRPYVMRTSGLLRNFRRCAREFRELVRDIESLRSDQNGHLSNLGQQPTEILMQSTTSTGDSEGEGSDV